MNDHEEHEKHQNAEEPQEKKADLEEDITELFKRHTVSS
jgi:hypothetical protein